MEYEWEQITRPEGYDIFPGMDPAANWLILGPGSSAFFQYIPEDQARAIEGHMESKSQDTTHQRGSLLPSMFRNISVPVVFDISDSAINDDAVIAVSNELRVDQSRIASGYFFSTPIELDNLFNNDGLLFSSAAFRQSFARSKASFKLCAPVTGRPTNDLIFEDGPEPVKPGAWRDETVIMAVIDDGIGFANQSFR